MDGKELYNTISKEVNSGVDSDGLVDAVHRDHNALQSAFFYQVIKPGIIAMASAPYTDLRNKQAVEKCREIADEMGWDY